MDCTQLPRIAFGVIFSLSVFARSPGLPASEIKSRANDRQLNPLLPEGQFFPSPKAPLSDRIKVLESNGERIVVEITFPPYQIETGQEQGTGFRTIAIPGCSKTTQPGAPELPTQGILLGIPPGTDLRLETRGFESSEESGYILRPAPSPLPQEDINLTLNLGQARDIHYSYVADEKIYGRAGFYPGTLATLGPVGFIRNQRLVSVSVFPVQYSPEQKTVRFYKKIRFTIHFQQRPQLRLDPALIQPQPASFEAILRSALVNYESAQRWRTMDRTSKPSMVAPPPTPGWKLFVDKDGIYRLTKTFLDSVGINLSAVNPKSLRIINRGTELPIYVEGEADGIFDAGDYIEFYGVAETTRYTSNNVYWLTYGGSFGLRMETRDGQPGDTTSYPRYFFKRLRFEENHYYASSVAEGEAADHWFWDYLIAPGNKDFTLPVPFVADTSGQAKVNVVLQGITYTSTLPDHHAEVLLNGNKITDIWWDGQTSTETEVAISPALLVAGNNTLRIRGPNDTGSSVDMFYINYFEIEYWRRFLAEADRLDFNYSESGTHCISLAGFTTSDLRLFDITNPAGVKRIVNGLIDQVAGSFRLRFTDNLSAPKRYCALASSQTLRPKKVVKDTASLWASPVHRADYLIVTNEDFYNAVEPLADWWRSKGLQTEVIRLTDIYDEFNYGIAEPRAIKDFLSNAYHSWQEPAPTYVLLVGDATFDPQDYLKSGRKDYLPTHFFQSSTYNFETASDHWFVCVEGEDRYPEFLVGRFTARTPTDVSNAIDKTLQYLQQSADSAWQKKALFVADNPDDAGDFEGAADELILDKLPPDFTPTKVYLTQCAGAADAKNKIISAINSGNSLTTYFGHGSIDIWAVENIFSSNDVGSLTNNIRYPLVSTLTCLDGYFSHAVDDYCLAEELARASTKGSVVCWAPTGYGYLEGHRVMAEKLFDAFFKNKIGIVGSAVAQAKIALLAEQPSLWDHAEMYTLFGDPATEMIFCVLPDLLPVELSFSPRSASAGDTVRISGIIENDGRATATDCEVQFYDNGAPIGKTIVIPKLAPDENTEVTFDWDTNGKIGLRTIKVIADPDDKIAESYEENNSLADTIRITDTTGVAEDQSPPSIEIAIDGKTLRTNYWFISSRPVIDVTVRDNAGIDSSGLRLEVIEAGKKLPLPWVTKLEHTTVTLSSRPFLTDGSYTLKVTATDRTGNKAESVLTLVVESDLKIAHILAYPNPCQTRTFFTYLLSLPAQEVRVKIYTLAGRRIRELWNAPGAFGFNSVDWDLRDENGAELSNGVYFYKIIATGMNGEQTEAVERLLILR